MKRQGQSLNPDIGLQYQSHYFVISIAVRQRTAKGFVIFKGSQAVVRKTPSIPPNISQARAKLIEKGIVTQNGNVYVFTADYECTSPSYASSIVRGSSFNGMARWANEAGKSLKALEAVD